MPEDRPASLHVVPSLWPPLIALGVVVALSLSMIVIDLVVDRHTAAETSELVGNSLRSVTIADDLRNQVHRLSQAGVDDGALAAIAKHIADDAREYNPIATFEGEVEEWSHLQVLIDRLQHARGEIERMDLLAQAELSIDRLIGINEREAATFEQHIRDAHTQGLFADLIVGLITLVLAAAVGIALVRSLRRQRALVRLHIESLGERNRDLEAFAARTAHDLKGPLAPLRGYADLLPALDPHVQHLALKIARATDRMASIIDDLLELSTSGHPPPGHVTVDTALRELLDDLAPVLDDVRVEVTVPPCAAACAPGVFHQIVRNVVTNAIKFRSPERPLAVRIDARHLDDTVELAIADNGVGMAPDVVEHAFEPFFRGRVPKSVPGHGLGLAIVKRTVDALGGSCKLESELDRGTRVVIRIPAVATAQARHSA